MDMRKHTIVGDGAAAAAPAVLPAVFEAVDEGVTTRSEALLAAAAVFSMLVAWLAAAADASMPVAWLAAAAARARFAAAGAGAASPVALADPASAGEGSVSAAKESGLNAISSAIGNAPADTARTAVAGLFSQRRRRVEIITRLEGKCPWPIRLRVTVMTGNRRRSRGHQAPGPDLGV